MHHIVTESLTLESNPVLVKQIVCLFHLSLLKGPTSERIIPALLQLHAVASETPWSCQKSATLKTTAR